jgi:hypothetical protein
MKRAISLGLAADPHRQDIFSQLPYLSGWLCTWGILERGVWLVRFRQDLDGYSFFSFSTNEAMYCWSSGDMSMN